MFVTPDYRRWLSTSPQGVETEAIAIQTFYDNHNDDSAFFKPMLTRSQQRLLNPTLKWPIFPVPQLGLTSARPSASGNST
ncbi:MAG TPA: hypothetical protein PKI05_00785, partial [Thermogutta sp.]|nr:hypothetical protein [Thermogutta sp.]